jgi:hypothetical protein
LIWFEDGENDLLELKVKRWIKRLIINKMAMCSKGGQGYWRTIDPRNKK